MEKRNYNNQQAPDIKLGVTDDQFNWNEQEKLAKKDPEQFMYGAFNLLQQVSQSTGIKVQQPEIVIVGGQSDGKSSLVEAIVGFKFNFIAVEMGTRVPLVLQLTHAPECIEPRCVFAGESKVIPVASLAAEIKERTLAITGGDEAVSSRPIILTVKFKHSPNLTVIDTPGFVGLNRTKTEMTMEAIDRMVEDLVTGENNHRIIVCLEQATVEWRNPTKSRLFVEKVDPTFSRTVMVMTKFDNRLAQIKTRYELDKYLSTGGILNQTKPFFIWLPHSKDDYTSINEYQAAIKIEYDKVLAKMREIGYDPSFDPQIGIFHLKQKLQAMYKSLNLKYLDPVISSVSSKEREVSKQLDQINAKIASSNSVNIKAKIVSVASKFSLIVEKVIEGETSGDPDTNGQTLDEEKDQADFSWEAVPWNRYVNFDLVPDKACRVYGGKQYARFMNEVEVVIRSMEMGAISPNEIATALGIPRSHFVPSVGHAASTLALKHFKASVNSLLPLIAQRLQYIANRMLPIVLIIFDIENPDAIDEAMKREISTAFDGHVQKTIEKWQMVAYGLLGGSSDMLTTVSHIVDRNDDDIEKDFVLNPSEEQVAARVKKEMQAKNNLIIDNSKGNDYQTICKYSSLIFSKLRTHWLRLVTDVTNAFFLNSFRHAVNESISISLLNKSDEELEMLTAVNSKLLKQQKEELDALKTKLSTLKSYFLRIRSDSSIWKDVIVN
jgi:GTP-binding protein EngB required for normal cell division